MASGRRLSGTPPAGVSHAVPSARGLRTAAQMPLIKRVPESGPDVNALRSWLAPTAVANYKMLLNHTFNAGETAVVRLSGRIAQQLPQALEPSPRQ
jgi:hypothetical protein